MDWRYLLVGIIMLAIGGITPISILSKIPLGFIISYGLIGFGVIVIIAGIFK